MDNRKIEDKSDDEKENEGKSLELKEFDPEKQIKIDSFIIVNAQRRYGKTIWYNIFKISFFII